MLSYSLFQYAFKRLLPAVLCCGVLLVGILPIRAETLKVGATTTGMPFTFLDVQTQKMQGVMVDIVNAVGKEAGFDADIQQTPFSMLVPSLSTGKIDIISVAMLKTPERERVVAFSDPVYSYGEGLVVSEKETHQYTSLDQLKGKVIGAQIGTTFLDVLNQKGYFKEVRSYDSAMDAVRDLQFGRISAAVLDYPIVAYQIKQNAFKGVKLMSDYEPERMGDVCLVIRQDDQVLMERINKAIATIKTDGTLEGILKKWGV